MATQECRAGSGVPTDIGAHKEVTSSRSDKEATGSRTHKSLPSFRRADLEQAANPQDGRTGSEKFKLRRTKSRPVIPLMEPLPMLLPRRPKLNPELYQTPEDVSTRSGPLKAESRSMMKKLSRQSVTNKEKTETLEGSNSRVKSSKSFRSHSSLVTADRNQLQQSYQTVDDQQNQQLKSTSASKNGQEENHSHHLLHSDKTSARPVKLSRPKSLPATIREAGVRFTRHLRKVQSEKTSTVPKLPQL